MGQQRYRLVDFRGVLPFRGTKIEFIAKNLKVQRKNVINLFGAVINTPEDLIIYIARYRGKTRNGANHSSIR